MQVLSEIKNRGSDDVCIVVCDGLKGLPESIETVWPLAIVQTCVLHLIRNSFKFASKRDWPALAKDLRPVYTAVNEADAADRLADFDGKWGQQYPAIKNLWDNAWPEFVPFLDYSPEIRRVIYSTDEIVKGSGLISGVASERRGLRRPVLLARRGPSLRRVAA